jgi:hypothetical protein
MENHGKNYLVFLQRTNRVLNPDIYEEEREASEIQ